MQTALLNGDPYIHVYPRTLYSTITRGFERKPSTKKNNRLILVLCPSRLIKEKRNDGKQSEDVQSRYTGQRDSDPKFVFLIYGTMNWIQQSRKYEPFSVVLVHPCSILVLQTGPLEVSGALIP